MTCIIALKEGNKIYMGADSYVTYESGYSFPTNEPKIFQREDMLIGAAGSARVVQLIKYGVGFPDRAVGQDTMDYLTNNVCSTLWKAFSEYQPLREPNGFPYFNCQMIVAIDGKLFEIGSDFSAISSASNYICAGGGAHYAYGAMYATRFEEVPMEPIKRIKLALAAAGEHCYHVGPPYYVYTLDFGNTDGQMENSEGIEQNNQQGDIEPVSSTASESARD